MAMTYEPNYLVDTTMAKCRVGAASEPGSEAGAPVLELLKDEAAIGRMADRLIEEASFETRSVPIVNVDQTRWLVRELLRAAAVD